MSGRARRGAAAAIGTAVVLAAVGAAAEEPVAIPPGHLVAHRLPRGDYETYWRQVDGDWRSGLVHTTIRGCAYPVRDACGTRIQGRYLDGETTLYNAFGCTRAAIAIRCVVQKAGAGLPRTGRSAPGFGSGRYLLKTSVHVVVVDLAVGGRRFRGVSDWNTPEARRDPIVGGTIRGGAISFTRRCTAPAVCVQRFSGTLIGDRASGLWTGTGTDRPVSWTLEPE